MALDNNLSVKPCMLFFIQTLPHILCAGAVSRVSFLDLFGLIAGGNETPPTTGWTLDFFTHTIPKFSNVVYEKTLS